MAAKQDKIESTISAPQIDKLIRETPGRSLKRPKRKEAETLTEYPKQENVATENTQLTKGTDPVSYAQQQTSPSQDTAGVLFEPFTQLRKSNNTRAQSGQSFDSGLGSSASSFTNSELSSFTSKVSDSAISNRTVSTESSEFGVGDTEFKEMLGDNTEHFARSTILSCFRPISSNPAQMTLERVQKKNGNCEDRNTQNAPPEKGVKTDTATRVLSCNRDTMKVEEEVELKHLAIQIDQKEEITSYIEKDDLTISHESESQIQNSDSTPADERDSRLGTHTGSPFAPPQENQTADNPISSLSPLIPGEVIATLNDGQDDEVHMHDAVAQMGLNSDACSSVRRNKAKSYPHTPHTSQETKDSNNGRISSLRESVRSSGYSADGSNSSSNSQLDERRPSAEEQVEASHKHTRHSVDVQPQAASDCNNHSLFPRNRESGGSTESTSSSTGEISQNPPTKLTPDTTPQPDSNAGFKTQESSKQPFRELLRSTSTHVDYSRRHAKCESELYREAEPRESVYDTLENASRPVLDPNLDSYDKPEDNQSDNLYDTPRHITPIALGTEGGYMYVNESENSGLSASLTGTPEAHPIPLHTEDIQPENNQTETENHQNPYDALRNVPKRVEATQSGAEAGDEASSGTSSQEFQATSTDGCETTESDRCQ